MDHTCVSTGSVKRGGLCLVRKAGFCGPA